MSESEHARAKRLVAPSFPRWGARVAWNWLEIGAIFALLALWRHQWAAYPAAILLLATRQHALAIMGHDGAHYAAAKNRRLNDWLTCVLTLWPMGMGLDGYRKFHFAHHVHTGTDQDPELIHKRWGHPEWSLPMTRVRLTGYVLRDLVGFAVRDIVRVIRIVKPVSRLDRLGPALWWSPVVAAAYFFHALWVPVVWWVSINTAYWAVFRVRMWTEHTGTAGTYRITAPHWMRFAFLPHNTWCHYEHHRWPAIPCWHLPAAREIDEQTALMTAGDLFRGYRDYPAMPYGVPVANPSEIKKAA